MANFRPNNEQSLSFEPNNDFVQVVLKPRWGFMSVILQIEMEFYVVYPWN